MFELNKDVDITCKEENKNLVKSFLNRVMFKDFKSAYNNGEIYGAVELQLKHACNQKCSYCYYAQHANGKELNSNSISTRENLIKNNDIFVNFLEKHQYFPKSMEVFGGEVLVQPKILYPILRRISDYYYKYNKPVSFVIPTNMTFLRKERFLNEYLNFKEEVESRGQYIGLSASVDGKYLDPINRNLIGKDPKDIFTDEHYDRIFTFSKEYGCGFHPMIHYDGIEKWKDTWLWFQENFKKYDIPWNNIYLLEVRNDGWTKETINEYYEFLKFVYHWILRYHGFDKELFVKSIIFSEEPAIRNCNTWNNIYRVGRGIGCSMQSVLSLRLGDLTVDPCHRQSYDALNGFKFITENDEITDIEVMNLDFLFSNITMDTSVMPYCETCLIQPMCNGGCPGSQYEYSGDAYLPIPSVCLLEHAKVKAQVDFLKEIGMFSDFLLKIDNDQTKSAFYNFYNFYN